MKGQAAVNTTRDYIRAAVFFANTAILLTTFSVGYAGERHKNMAHVRSVTCRAFAQCNTTADRACSWQQHVIPPIVSITPDVLADSPSYSRGIKPASSVRILRKQARRKPIKH